MSGHFHRGERRDDLVVLAERRVQPAQPGQPGGVPGAVVGNGLRTDSDPQRQHPLSGAVGAYGDLTLVRAGFGGLRDVQAEPERVDMPPADIDPVLERLPTCVGTARTERPDRERQLPDLGTELRQRLHRIHPGLQHVELAARRRTRERGGRHGAGPAGGQPVVPAQRMVAVLAEQQERLVRMRRGQRRTLVGRGREPQRGEGVDGAHGLVAERLRARQRHPDPVRPVQPATVHPVGVRGRRRMPVGSLWIVGTARVRVRQIVHGVVAWTLHRLERDPAALGRDLDPDRVPYPAAGRGEDQDVHRPGVRISAPPRQLRPENGAARGGAHQDPVIAVHVAVPRTEPALQLGMALLTHVRTPSRALFIR